MPQTARQDQADAIDATQYRDAQIVPASFNADENTVDVLWTVGARGTRYDWMRDQVYEEELAVTDSACDMSRFDAGAVQVLDSHDTWGGVRSILGIATRGWLKSGEGRATVKLSQDPAKAGVVADIRAGIIRSISVGYRVLKYTITAAADRTDGGKVPLYRATNWQPHELSFVSVPFDMAAGTRSLEDAQQRHHPQVFPPDFQTRAQGGAALKEPTMTEEERAAAAAAEANKRALDEAVAAATRKAEEAAETKRVAELARVADINKLCTTHNLPALAERHIREGSTVDVVRAAILDERARLDAAGGGHQTARVQTVNDETQTRLEGVTEALLSRVDHRTPLTDNGRQYRGLSLMEMGRELLLTQGVNTRGMDKYRIATEMSRPRTDMQIRLGGLMTTSDFPGLLSAVANKRLRSQYDENPGTFRLWARRAPNLVDFKPVNLLQRSAMPDLLKVNEHGEFAYGALGEGTESYKALTYGRIIGLTRQAMINDDLRAFDTLVTGFADSAARLENRTVYAQITGNPLMGDGNALFSTAHGNNFSGGGSALQLTSLTATRLAMRLQKGLQGEELNIVPRTAIFPAALEQLAYQLTSANYVPATQANTNEFRAGGKTAIEPIIEPILDAASQTAWYMLASNSQVDTVEYAYLDGAEGPVMESQVGFEIDGMAWKCREDFAAKAVDWRGMARNVGV